MMKKKEKSKEDLIAEIINLHRRIATLEKARVDSITMEEILRRERDMAKKYLDIAGVMVLIIDSQKKITMINKKGCELLGYEEEEIKGKNWFDNFLPEKLKKNVTAVFEKLMAGEIEPVEYYENPVLTKDGGEKMIAWHNTVLKNEKGEIVAILTSGTDITDRKKVDEEMKELVVRDYHTGCYNHRYLEDAIDSEFSRSKRMGQPISAIMLDIDYFKSINNVYGHQFGDLILKQFAEQLMRMVRSYDIVTRYGGEEFVILSPGTSRIEAVGLAQRILDAVNLYNFGTKKTIVKIKLSMSVASYPDDIIVKSGDLIDLADKILDKAKSAGGNTVFSSLDLKETKPSGAGKMVDTDDIKRLKTRIDKLTKQSNESLAEAVFAFAKTIELKDHYTGSHMEETVGYAVKIAKMMGLDKNGMERVRKAAMLHDLGKIAIKESILNKKGKLTKKEYEIIKTHPKIAIDIIRPIRSLQDIILPILYHHEQWDGKGYPHGLKNEEIPLEARIVSIADVFHALTSNRPYRKAYSKKEAIEMIKKDSEIKFDPSVVKAFLRVMASMK